MPDEERVIARCAVCRSHFESERRIEEPGELPLLCPACLEWQQLCATTEACAHGMRASRGRRR